MKKTFLRLAVVSLLGLILPALIADDWGTVQAALETGGSGQGPATFDRMTTVKVYFHETGQIREMPIGEYLTSVVAGEMPATFHEEALKAQAVAARSYTLNKMAQKPDHETEGAHPGADVCTDYRHCKTFLPKSQAKKIWGEAKFLEYWTKIEKAVSDTDGEVVCYEDEPICAVFHSTSAGKTEDAKNIWGGTVSYLTAVDSPGEENSPRFHSAVRLSPGDFSGKLKELAQDIELPEEPQNWVGAVEKSPSGTVLHMVIGNRSFTGVELRSLFGLRSAVFDLTYGGGAFTFAVTGYGHGVGMSQYGAEHMAEGGTSYRDILTWYYTGTQIKNENQ
jgi:stage II sporulation protein D